MDCMSGRRGELVAGHVRVLRNASGVSGSAAGVSSVLAACSDLASGASDVMSRLRAIAFSLFREWFSPFGEKIGDPPPTFNHLPAEKRVL
jgi:hypothetical protein